MRTKKEILELLTPIKKTYIERKKAHKESPPEEEDEDEVRRYESQENRIVIAKEFNERGNPFDATTCFLNDADTTDKERKLTALYEALNALPIYCARCVTVFTYLNCLWIETRTVKCEGTANFNAGDFLQKRYITSATEVDDESIQDEDESDFEVTCPECGHEYEQYSEESETEWYIAVTEEITELFIKNYRELKGLKGQTREKHINIEKQFDKINHNENLKFARYEKDEYDAEEYPLEVSIEL